MGTFRSTGFIAAAILAAGTTTALCFGDALGLVPGQAANSAIAAVPVGATTEPLAILRRSSPWLTPVPGGVQALRGKVVLVNFWTYSCINSLRALPYLRAWNDRYASKGLVVVGVHAPEFGFEKDAAKVRLASAQQVSAIRMFRIIATPSGANSAIRAGRVSTSSTRRDASGATGWVKATIPKPSS